MTFFIRIIKGKSMVDKWSKAGTYLKESGYVEVSDYLCIYEDDYK